MWLGFNDQAIEGTFEWTDGTPNDFNAWDDESNEPNNSRPTGEDCTEMWKEAGLNWNDRSCSWTRAYLVCKMPLWHESDIFLL